MDVCFDLLVRSIKPMPQLEDLSRTVTWFGVEQVIDVGRFGWGSRRHIDRHSSPPGHVMKRVPRTLRHVSWEVYGISGEGLNQMHHEAWGGDVEWHGFDPWSLLRSQLVSTEDWILVFMPMCEELAYVHHGDVELAIRALRDDLSREDGGRGFMVVHQASERRPGRE